MKPFTILSILFCLLIGSIVTAHTYAHAGKYTMNNTVATWMFSEDPNEILDPNEPEDPNDPVDPNIVDPGE
jgi:hypothetical protein